MKDIIPKTLKPQKLYSDTLLYLDERGHTEKSQIEDDKHKKMDEFRAKTRLFKELDNITITEKPVTVVNKGHYKNLEEIVDETFKMWDEVGYWNEQVLFRTGSFTTKQGLFSVNIPNKGKAFLIEEILKLLEKGNNPDQFLLHPVPSKELFDKGFLAARCYSVDSVCRFEAGYGSIDQVWQLEQADNIVTGSVYLGKQEITVQKGEVKSHNMNVLKDIATGFFHFCLLAPDVVVPSRPQGERSLIYEFKCFDIEDENRVIIEFIDFEIYK